MAKCGADIEPMVLMHGTARRFDAFDAAHVGSGASCRDEDEIGFFFTANRAFAGRYACGPDGGIVTAALTIENPYRVTGEMWGKAEGLSPRQALEAGHDAYVVSPYEEGDMVIAFRIERIEIIGREDASGPATDPVLIVRAA